MSDDLIKQLRATRDDYAAELVWHRFLIDAYTGTGGFSGAIRQPATGYLGWAAETYSDNAVARHRDTQDDVVTYLDRYPREDNDKFQRRRDVAHYPNHAESIVDLLLSFVLKREMTIEGRPGRIDSWAADVDGKGTSWDKLRNRTLIPRAALLGWTPLLLMAGQVDQDSTRASEGANLRALPLFPANLLDWQVDAQGNFEWVKLRLDYRKRADPLGPAVETERYIIWERDRIRQWTIEKVDNKDLVTEEDEIANQARTIPVVIWRHKPCPDDPVRGIGMIDGVASEIRRLFNLLSELDEHMRQQVFAMLQVPAEVSEVTAGTDNALPLPAESKHEYKWLSPDTGPAETYENRIANTITEIYRLARTETDDAERVTDSSGVARGYAFEKTNRRLGDFAESIADGEIRTYKAAAPLLGLGDDSLAGARAVAPTDFKVEDLATAIANAIQAVDLGLGPTAETRIKQRVIDILLPNLSDDDRKAIDSEIEEQAKLKQQDAAEMREIQRAGAAVGEDGGDDGLPADDGEEAAE
jgi:hypothetical protein